MFFPFCRTNKPINEVDRPPACPPAHQFPTRFRSHVFCPPSAPARIRRRTGNPELQRLLISPFIHGDDVHLFSNMGSFLFKGVALELTMGTQAFAGLLGFALLASQLLMVLAAWVLLVVFEVPSPMQACSVGFSGVLFALTYVWSRRSPGLTTVSDKGEGRHRSCYGHAAQYCSPGGNMTWMF